MLTWRQYQVPVLAMASQHPMPRRLGPVLQLLLPSAFEVLPAAYTIQRAVLAGLLVGIGSAMGSGCTSGAEQGGATIGFTALQTMGVSK